MATLVHVGQNYITLCLRAHRKFLLLFGKPKMASNAHVSQIFTIHITSCQRGDRTGKAFWFLFGENPRWRPLHTHVSHIYTVHITSCQRGDRPGRFSFFFQAKTQRWRPMHTWRRFTQYTLGTSFLRGDRTGSFYAFF
jgi:hypothetical protein